MSNINILFYSNNCEGSKHLISVLQTEQLIRFFHLICTDNNPKVPALIKVTPTIIIRGDPRLLIAADAFAWVSKVKQWKINMQMQKMTAAQQQYMQSINGNLVSNESNLLGFNPSEMAGMSDIFSFFSSNMAQECNEALPQSFFTCSNLGQENIFTPPTEDARYKINEAKQKELHNNLQMERNKQDETIKQTINNFRKQYGAN